MEKDRNSPKKKNNDPKKEKQRSGTTTTTTTLANIPLEILLDILSRLPAKAVFGYRLVCKCWLSLVRDPRFVKMHLARASQSQNENPSLIFHSRDCNNLLLDDLDVSNLAVKLQHPFMELEPWYKIVGSCNGLVCIMEELNYFDTFIHIFNPVTGEYAKVPLPSFIPQTNYSVAAFCYHPLTDEYKILLGENEFFIYTLGSNSNSWRKMKDTQLLCTGFSSSGVNVNGAINWLSSHSNMGALSFSIISFDIGEEESRVFEHPFELILKYMCELGVLGGCLSLSYCLDQKLAEIWVMKEYGLKESWTKLFVIEGNAILADNFYLVRSLCIFNSGKILLEICGGELVFYDPKTKMVSAIRVLGFPESSDHIMPIYGSLIHVGSLVSLRTIIGRVEGHQ